MIELRNMRVGIIGTGMMGEVHARAVRAAGGTVGSIVGSTEAAGRAALPRLGAATVARSVDEMLGDPLIDVVHVCTPNATHFNFASQALRAGKAVVCEKPLSVSSAQATELVAIAADSGLVNAVPFVYRFYPSVRDARRRIRAGEAGRMTLLHGSYLQDWLSDPNETNWRVQAGVGGQSRAFGDIGIHWCDLMEFVTGHRIERLFAQGLTSHADRGGSPVDTEDAAALVFETNLGALGSVLVSQITLGRKNKLQFSFDGTASSVCFDQELPDMLHLCERASNRIVLRGEVDAPEVSRYTMVPPGHPQGYQDCFNGFVADVFAAVAGEPVDGLPTFADGHRSAMLIDAFLESSQTNSWVEVAK